MLDPELRDEGPQVTSRTLRQFAGLWLAFFGGFAVWEYLGRDRPMAAVVLAILAVSVGFLGLAVPTAIQPVFMGLMAVTRPIGWVVSRVLLLILYYGVFTPVALLFRLMGRDALHRRRPSGVETYWQVKPAPAEMASYFRQS
jgi:hypothetical protein